MDDDFVLLNADTIFGGRVLHRLPEGRPSPITINIDHKDSYDDDDMKVSIHEDGRLLAIGKTLKPEIVNGESIGMLCFRASGPGYLRGVVERTMREPEALRACYLSVVNEIAQDTSIDTTSVRGLSWREIDEATGTWSRPAGDSRPGRIDPRRGCRPLARAPEPPRRRQTYRSGGGRAVERVVRVSEKGPA